ncbi:LytTR family transcriptional regulator [Clostridiaceae bacterium UIB06]|uniref:LytTR family transcriptional regulator n=1 Tax=Clostridium thailandense TaxID=2794346 RepID=A0A949WWU9_9CLOT|nr:LytTR family DNA-binding domain-containing protein [Clostridium thailandense]MBV7275227.1 LytTR family transcriptional regulator [Clostridium thailandense]MCH5137738.1 LytTR family transcriptional regulator [Clostridiaceae bacterium UIB06]
MEIDLICCENIRRVLEELLNNRKIKISKDAKVCIVEKGFDIEEGKIGIYFDMTTINVLIDYLDQISISKEEFKNIITGRCEEDNLKVLTYDNIYYFEAMGNDVFGRTKDKKYKVKEKLYELEEKLESKGFIRVSKCFIVNIVKVDRIISWFNSRLILKMIDIDEEVYVTRKYLNDFKKFLGV